MTKTIYSFSRLNSFHDAIHGDGCLFNWYKTYIEDDRGDSNFFAEYGTLFHTLIEKLHKKELFLWDVEDEIKKGLANFEFDAPFPPMLKSYKTAIYDFFNDFDNIFADYQIQQAEEEKTFQVGGYEFRGYPDAIGQHKRFGMVILDFKSSKRYSGENLKKKQRQLYMYSIPFIEEYGYEPEHLLFMFLREKSDRELAIKFNKKDYEDTKNWMIETCKKIESFLGEWTPRCAKVDGSNDFYASWLCSHRETCEHRFSFNDPFNSTI